MALIIQDPCVLLLGGMVTELTRVVGTTKTV